MITLENTKRKYYKYLLMLILGKKIHIVKQKYPSKTN